MNYFLLAFLIWISILGIVFWRRRVYLKKTENERELERIRRRWWWAGNSFSVIACKFLLLVGLVCVVANVVLQGLIFMSETKECECTKVRPLRCFLPFASALYFETVLSRFGSLNCNVVSRTKRKF